MKFVAFATMPIPQARFALSIPYGITNEGANKYIPPERLAVLPSAPENKKQMITRNVDWWIDNGDKTQAQSNNWLLG